MKNNHLPWLLACCWLLPALAVAQVDHDKGAQKRADDFGLKIRVTPADTITCATQTVDVVINYKNLAGQNLFNFEIHTWFPNELTKYFVFDQVIYAPGNRQPSTDFCRIDQAVWNVGTLQVNQQDSIIFRLHLARRPPRLTTFTYRAEATASGIFSPQVAASHIFAPRGSGCGEPPDLSISKRANRSTASVGDEVIFSLTVSNAPNVADQMNVVVEDRVPAGLLVDAARVAPGPSSIETLPNGSQLIRWSFPGAFPASTSRTLTVPATVTLNPACRVTLFNSCQANGDVPELYCSNTASSGIEIVPKYDFRLELLGDSLATVAPGDTQEYVLKITNFSTVGVNNLDLLVSIDDALPFSNCYSIANISDRGFSRAANTEAAWIISRIDSGATVTRSLKLHYDKIQYTERGQKIKFVAQIDSIFCNVGDSPRADNTDRWERTKDFAIDLVLDPAPENDMPEASFDVTKPYHLIVRNVSKVALPLTYLRVRLNPLPGTDPNRIVINGVNGVRPIPPWTIPPLAAGESASNMLNISIEAICDTGTYGFTIEAGVDPVPNETDTTNNRRTWQTKAKSKYDLELKFTGIPVKRIIPGEEERYDLEVKNSSTLRIDSVMVELTINDGLPNGNCYSIKPGGVDEVSASEDTVRWLIRLLDPGKTVTRSVTLKYDKLDSLKLGQSVHFVAAADSVFCNLPDAKPADNAARWLRTKAEHFDLVLDPAPENNRSARFDMPETYHLTVINASTDSVPATTLHVKLTSLDPRGAALIDMRVDGMRVSDLDTSWAIPALASNQIERKSFDVTVHAPQDSGRYCFQMAAWVDTLANESDSTNNRREWEACVGPVYDVRLRFTGEKQRQIRPQQKETYELEVVNLSTFRVDSVKLALNINDGLADRNCYSIIGNPDNAIPSSDSAKVEWMINTLAAGDTVRYSLTLRYDKIEFLGLGKNVSFTAKVDTLLHGQPDQNPNDNADNWVRTKSFAIEIELDSLESNNRPNASFDVPEKYQLIVKNNSEVTTPAVMLHVNLDLQAFGETVRSRIAMDGVSNLLQKSWPIPPLAPGASDTVKLIITIAAHDRSGIYGFDMIATVDALAGERVTANNRRTWRTTVVAAFDLQLAFLGDSTMPYIVPGAVEKYELELRNLSKFRVDRALLKVKIDDGMAGSNCYRIKEISAGGTASPDGQLVQWLIETLAPVDSVTRYVELEYNNIQHGDLGKKVHFTAEVDTLYRGESDQTPADNFDRWERTKQFHLDLVLAPEPDNDRPQAQFETRYPYRLTVKNASAVQVPGTKLNVELVPYTNPATLADRIDMRVNGIRLSNLKTSWPIPPLAPDSSATRFFDATIFTHDAAGKYGFTAHAWIDTLANESDSTNNRRQWQTTVNYNPRFDLRLTYSGASQGTIKPGDSETYALVVTNLSTFRVDSATLSLNIDDGMSGRDSYTIAQISNREIPPPSTPIFWRIGPLLPAESVARSLTLRYDKIDVSNCGQRVNFTAKVDTVYRGLPDSTWQDNTVQWSRLQKFKVDLALEEPLPSNERVTRFDKRETYRFIVRNNSEAPVESCSLQVQLVPLNANTQRDSIKVFWKGNPIGGLAKTWHNISLLPKASFIDSLQVEIGKHEPAGTYGFFMHGNVQIFSCDDSTANNSATWRTRVFHNPKYEVSLDFTGKPTDTVRPNQQEPDTLKVQNFSTFPVDGLVLKVRIDDGVPGRNCYSILPLRDGGSNVADTLLQWRLSTLDSGKVATRVFTIRYDKVEAADSRRTVRFFAEIDTVYRGERDSNPADNRDRWERTKEFNLDLVLDPVSGNNHPNAGFNAPEPYRFIVSNASDVPLSGLKLCVKLAPLPGTPAERIQILPNSPGDLDTCWTISALAPNATLERELGIAILAQDCPDSGTYGFTMTAWVDTVAGESDITNNRREWQTQALLKYDAQLAFLGKSTGSIRPGQVEPYELLVRNLFTIRLDSVSLLLTIDDGMADGNCYTIQDSDGGDTLRSGQVRWVIPALAPRDSVKRTLTLNYNKITASDLGRRVQFTAQLDTVLCRQPDQNPADNRKHWERIKDFKLDLVLEPEPENNYSNARFNVPETYRLIVRNASDVSLAGLKLCVKLDTLPGTPRERIQILSNSPGDLDTCFAIATLTPNATLEQEFAIAILAQDCHDSGTYGFTMTAWVDTVANESDSTNNRRVWQTLVRLDYDVQLAFSGDSTGSIRPGQVEPYELVVRNLSAIRLDSVSLLLTINDGMKMSNCYTITDVSDDGDTLTSGQVRWMIPSLAPRDAVTKTLTLYYNKIAASDLGRRVQFAAQLDTLLCHRPNQKDQNPKDNRQRWERKKAFNLDLVLEPASENNQPNAPPNIPVPYRFIVRNASDVPLHDLKLCVKLDTLPGTPRERIKIEPNPPGGDFEMCWPIALLALNGMATQEINVTVLAHDCPDSGAYGFTMTAWVDTVANESDSTNNRRVWQTKALLKYDLQLAFLGKPTGSISPDDNESYELVVQNLSTIRLDNVSLLLNIDDGVKNDNCYTIQDSDGGDTLVSGQVKWVILSLAPGDSVKKKLTLYYNKIAASDLGRRVQFTAQLDTLLCRQRDQNQADNKAGWERMKAFKLDLVLAPEPANNRPQARFEKSEKYYLTVRNASDVPLFGMTLYVKLIPLPGTLPERIQVAGVDGLSTKWPLRLLAPKDSVTQALEVTILAHDDAGTYGFTMEAWVDPVAGESDTTNNRRAWQTTVAITNADLIEAFYLERNLFRPALDNTVEMYLKVRENTEVRFTIYNVAGELVRAFPSRRAAIGNRLSEFWDGRNDRGDFVGSGLYFIFAEVDYKRERPSRRLVIVR